jgi:hypothetical protein
MSDDKVPPTSFPESMLAHVREIADGHPGFDVEVGSGLAKMLATTDRILNEEAMAMPPSPAFDEAARAAARAVGTPAAFDFAGFNGRDLADDVMDVILTLAATLLSPMELHPRKSAFVLNFLTLVCRTQRTNR